MKILVTGGYGFIGSAVVHDLLSRPGLSVVNIDKLTYAANELSLASVHANPGYESARIDIADGPALAAVFQRFQPDMVMHLAAESHVDRSIDEPSAFIQTNVVGTSVLLECARQYWIALPDLRRDAFRFLHVSTDEVFGDLAENDAAFTESSRYQPSSPYSASKAASDHLVRAWFRTFGLPILITNCSNNYGPRHFPEKLVPHMILNALAGKPLPIYGDGTNIRDWLYVEDHARALFEVLTRGTIGDTYMVGGRSERCNIDLVRAICAELDIQAPDRPNGLARYEDLITFVPDRPGHDHRYAVDATKIERELGWKPQETLRSGLAKTIAWYLANSQWWQSIVAGDYEFQRLGLQKEVAL